MSVLATTTGSTASGKASASAPTTSTTRVSSVPGRVAILGILDRILVLFILLAVNGTPLFNLAFERGI